MLSTFFKRSSISLCRQSFRAFSKKGEQLAGFDQLTKEEKDKIKEKIERVVGGHISDIGKGCNVLGRFSDQYPIENQGAFQGIAEKEWGKENVGTPENINQPKMPENTDQQKSS